MTIDPRLALEDGSGGNATLPILALFGVIGAPDPDFRSALMLSVVPT
jgi:hypothetical protein